MEPVTLKMPSPIIRGKTDHFALFDSPVDLARFADEKVHGSKRNDYGSGHWSETGWKQTVRNAIDGALDAVEESEKLLALFEREALPSARHEIIDDVVGAVPNVPAFIAGHPMNMRRKIRRENEAAPIAIVVDLTSSGGISSAILQRRGAALLALARALSARRPVELWAGTGLGGGQPYWTFCRLQTSPMDLAHVAPVLAGTGFARLLCYGICQQQGSGGSWPYHHRPLTAAEFEKVIRQAMPHIAELVAVPAAYLSESPELKDPAKWVRDKIAAYGGTDAAAA